MASEEFQRDWEQFKPKPPKIDLVDYKKGFENKIKEKYSDQSDFYKIMTEYPTVYIIFDENRKPKGTFNAYVGETNDIVQRTTEHLNDTDRKDFEKLNLSDSSKMFVIGHQMFNKSLTMDIENEMMLYLSSVPAINQINNRRDNPQSKYFTETKKDEIFAKTWEKLRRSEKGKYLQLFPPEAKVEQSAIFKSSPFHKLNREQEVAKNIIMNKVKDCLANNRENNQLILVEGDAGAGKTVLLSTVFYLISKLQVHEKDVNEVLLVNHEQQLQVYSEIAKKLGMVNKKDSPVQKPTHFINQYDENNKVDVSLIDEGHLLWTQGNQSYQGQDQLDDIVKRSKITILVYDPHQIVERQSFTENQKLERLEEKAKCQGNLIPLSTQMRMQASPEVLKWIDDFIYKGKINPLPHDKNYPVRVFDNPFKMEKLIKEKNKSDEDGVSRIVATFDWDYKGKKPKDKKTWDVAFNSKDGYFSRPWNLQLKRSGKKKAWAEMPQTINEIGSTFTIQGFDLNYVGVILGPSIVYRDGKVQIDSSKSKDIHATYKRNKKDVSLPLLKNALNVLMTRGVHGLYLYAVDDELEKKLLELQSVK